METKSGGWKIYLSFFMVMFALIATAFILYADADRKGVEKRAAKDILFDATLASASLDAILRVASRELAYLGDTCDAIKYNISQVAFHVPEASNIYLLDETGTVLEAARRRLAPTLSMDSAIFQRMDAGATIDCRIVDAPAEGGRVLAFVRKIEGAEECEYRFAAALFTGYTLQSGVSTLLSRAYGSIDVTDSDGVPLVLVEADAPVGPARRATLDETKQDGNLTEAVSLAVVPIKIRVSVDRTALFSEWRARTAVLCSVTVALTLAIGTMLMFGYLFFRRRLRVERLCRDIEARDTLFREVNHRVKNNLTIVQTILEFGAEEIGEYRERASFTMQSAIDRLRAMALLHELLYSHAADTQEDAGSYVRALTDAVTEAYGFGDRIDVEERHEEGLHCSLNRMVPLALIVNELLTNAYKYAYPDNRRGTVQVRSVRGKDGGIVIDIRDDGIGFSDAGKRPGGIGTMLIEALVSQIGGTIERSGGPGAGTGWKLVIPPETDFKGT